MVVPPDPSWPAQAEDEKDLWLKSVDRIFAIHHIGSTSVPDLPAKPIIDLLCVFDDAAAQKAARPTIEAMEYEWLGEHGLEGRTYARKSDPNGVHLFHAHCYADGHPSIRRHLAFRNALRESKALRAEYASVKSACAARYPEGGTAYGNCKSNWIEKAEANALEYYR